jgi:hypothetical protein
MFILPNIFVGAFFSVLTSGLIIWLTKLVRAAFRVHRPTIILPQMPRPVKLILLPSPRQRRYVEEEVVGGHNIVMMKMKRMRRKKMLFKSVTFLNDDLCKIYTLFIFSNIFNLCLIIFMCSIFKTFSFNSQFLNYIFT